MIIDDTQATTCRICLATPKRFTEDQSASKISSVIDDFEIANLRLELETDHIDEFKRAADMLLRIVDDRDISIVVNDRIDLVDTLGLHGVHLRDGARRVRAARSALGKEAIVGAFCGATRHVGMEAGEAGADYVAFGPVRAFEPVDTEIALPRLFDWWRKFILVPSVAEQGIDAQNAARLAESADFLLIGSELWEAECPQSAMAALSTGLQ